MGQYDYVLGPMVLSTFVNTYVSGLVGFQYAAYQSIKFKDPFVTKAVVLALFVIDAFQVIIAIYMAWVYCVANYIDPTALDRVGLWTYTVIPLCNSVSGVIAHSFLGYRISTLMKGKIACIIIAILTCAAFVLGAVSGIYGIVQHISMLDALTDSSLYRPLIIAWLATQSVLDSTISGNLAHVFYQQGQNFMNHVTSPLIRIGSCAIQCGSLATLFSFCSLVVFLASTKSSAYIVFLLPIGRLYSNAVLTTLLLRDKRTAMPDRNQANPSTVIWAVAGGTRPTHVQSFSLVQIRTEQEIVVDSEDVDEQLTSEDTGYKRWLAHRAMTLFNYHSHVK
ncbi:hypothetical protein BDZ97DRAFT_492451 [Flammula alnicola]|nr:hypothetical protein BDZ97DRAFT_492451 [Flammula alnicola]